MKRFVHYVFYSLFIIILLIAGLKITLYLRLISAKTFSSTPSIIAATFFPLFLGIFLACPFILSKFKKPGRISIDWTVIFSVCIPSLFINMSLILGNFSPLGKIIPDFLRLFNDLQAIAISGLVFIFSLLYSIKKSS